MSNPLNDLENEGYNYVNISGSVPALDLLASERKITTNIYNFL